MFADWREMPRALFDARGRGVGGGSDPRELTGYAPPPRIEPTEFRSCLLAFRVFRGASHKSSLRCDASGLRGCAGPPRDPLMLRFKGPSCPGSLLPVADKGADSLMMMAVWAYFISSIF